MEWIDFRRQSGLQGKLANLLARLGSYERVYAFVQRYKFCSISRDGFRALLDTKMLVLTGADYMRLYPRVCAQIIAYSHGYATPRMAANILRDAMESGLNNCEWIASCYNKDARQAVYGATQHRHNPAYRDAYAYALALVRHELAGGKGPELASWF